MESNLFLVLTLLVLAEADFGLLNPTIPQRSLREIVNKRRQLSYIKNLLQDLDDKLETLEKRNCPINIPGTDCDYGELTGTAKDMFHWESRVSPGKRRRYRRALQYLL